jgi:hypothetical protein
VLLFPRQEGKRKECAGVPGGCPSVVAGEAAGEGRRARGSPRRRHRQPPLEEEERASERARVNGRTGVKKKRGRGKRGLTKILSRCGTVGVAVANIDLYTHVWST